MRILFVDDKVDGHHNKYLSGIIERQSYNFVLIASSKFEKIECKQYITGLWPSKNPIKYLFFLLFVAYVARKEKVDLIHFLTLDTFIRYGGFGFCFLNKYKKTGSLHKVRTDIKHIIGIRLLSTKLKTIVVHSKFLSNQLNQIRVYNTKVINYPSFHSCLMDKAGARMFFGFANSYPILLCIGATRYDKGLDILLSSLQKIKMNYNLFIAGQEDYFNSEFIQNCTRNIKNKIIILKELSDQEYNCAIRATDFVIIPYRNVFNGASGPLCDGVFDGKIIIGTDKNNIGFLISNYHLGYVFESENSQSLSKTIELALTNSFKKDKEYTFYQKTLSPETFNFEYNHLFLKNYENS